MKKLIVDISLNNTTLLIARSIVKFKVLIIKQKHSWPTKLNGAYNQRKKRSF